MHYLIEPRDKIASVPKKSSKELHSQNNLKETEN